jgi:hypothetical protein
VPIADRTVILRAALGSSQGQNDPWRTNEVLALYAALLRDALSEALEHIGNAGVCSNQGLLDRLHLVSIHEVKLDLSEVLWGLKRG